MMQQIPQAVPAVWVYTTTPSFNSMRFGGYGSFLTPDQQARLERIRQARMLYDGKHREYYLGEQRTQFDFPAMRAGDRIHQPYVMINAIQLVCNKTADLLFGVSADIDTDDEIQAAKIADLEERSSLDRLFYSTCLECAYEAEGFLEACIEEGEVYLQSIPADEIFPMGRLGPNGQYKQYVRYRLKNISQTTKPIWLLLETTYLPGSITNRLWQLDENQRKLTQPLALDQWPLEAGEAPLLEVITTGIDRCTVTWVYNFLSRKQPASLIDRLITIQDSLNAKQTQIDRVLAKHSDPKLWFPRSAADQTGNVRSDYDVSFGDDKSKDMPEYIVWQASLEAAQKSKSEALALLCLTAEISPALLGLKEGAAPEAARKLRLEATNTLAMVQRVGANWKPAIKRAIGVAQDLEQTIPGSRYDVGPISVGMRDGLPIDELDQAQEISLKRASNAMSIERAVSLQIEDKEDADAEVALIKGEQAAAVPNVLMGDMSGSGETLPQDKIPSAEADPTQKSDGGAS